MTKRRLIMILILVVLAALAMVYVSRRDERFNEASFERIKLGMSEAEVEAVLGCPSGDYSRPRDMDSFSSPSDPVGFHVRHSGASDEELKEMRKSGAHRVTWKKWWGNSWGVEVAFDEKGSAISKILLHTEQDFSIFLRIRRILGLR